MMRKEGTREGAMDYYGSIVKATNWVMSYLSIARSGTHSKDLYRGPDGANFEPVRSEIPYVSFSDT